jgi:hypothetical protein
LYYNRARWLSPSGGAFVSQDLLTDNFDRYFYAGQSPADSADPTGLFELSVASLNVLSGLQNLVLLASQEEGFRGNTLIHEAEAVAAVNPLLTQVALDDARDILSTNTRCARFLCGVDANGTEAYEPVAEKALERFSELLRHGNLEPLRQKEFTLIEQSGVATLYRLALTGQPAFRTLPNVIVNRYSPFFHAKSTFTGTKFSDIGPFRPATRGARVLAVLHEIAHLVFKKSGTPLQPLIPNDGASPNQSRQNTETVAAACRSELQRF